MEALYDPHNWWLLNVVVLKGKMEVRKDVRIHHSQICGVYLSAASYILFFTFYYQIYLFRYCFLPCFCFAISSLSISNFIPGYVKDMTVSSLKLDYLIGYKTITDRLRKVSWIDNSHSTHGINLKSKGPTIPLPAIFELLKG